MNLRTKIILFFIFISTSAFAQIDFSAGMGIDFPANSSLYDYLNTHWTAPREDIAFFDSNVEFYAEAGYPVSPGYQVGLEYSYAIYSFGSNYRALYDLSYNMHSITLLGYYVFSGTGYKLKLGGGIGYRNMMLSEKINLIEEDNYNLNGVGLQFKADGNTSLGGDLYANISFILRFDYLGNPKGNSSIALTNTEPITEVNFFSITPGIRLGVSYFF